MTSNTELSWEQQRIWHEGEPDTATRHLCTAYEIRDPLDRAALDRAARAVVDRHEPLRTTFHERDGRPFGTLHETPQQVVRVVPVPSADDWTSLAGAEARTPFDVGALPLVRMTLFAIADDHHVLTVVMHPLVSDDAGMDVLLGELSDAYLAMRDGGDWMPAALPGTDHVERERTAAADGSWAEDLAYWRDRLFGAPATFTMPGTGQRPRQPTLTSRHVQASLSADIGTAVAAFARQQGATPVAVLLAAWVATLSRYSGERDILVGMTVPDRERLIGHCTNAVTLRLQLRDGMTFDELVDDVRDEIQAALSHRHPPLAAVVAELGGERSPVARLSFDTAPPSTGVLTRLPWDAAAVRTDLELVVTETSPELLTLRADADVYRQDTTEGLIEHTITLLRHALAEPGTPVDRLRLMTEEQHRDLVERCAPARTPLPDVRSVLDMVVETIARHPDVPAVRSGQRVLTFAELGRHAGSLAERLARHGVAAGDVVALHLDRSVELLLGMLASWQLGAAYVPVDPTYPRRRVEFVLRDARAQVIITGSATPPDMFDAPVVVFDATDDDDAEGPPLTARSEGSGEESAYILYTSGSTGQPKGVNVPHRAVVNLLVSMARQPGVTADDVVLAVTSPSFDMSVPELLLPLTTGARMVIASTEDARDPQRVLDLVTAQRVTVMSATPVTWSGLVALAPENLPLRVAMCAGEALIRTLANDLCRVADEVWNMYGPTETTVYSLVNLVPPEADDVAVPVGCPIDNTSAWVLDAGLGVLPIGVVGELYLGGVGLALEYRGRPDLTGQRFVTGPPETGGERLYRTGDLVRLRRDGCFDFLGRADTQVKIRGHRIEVEEIATLLRRHPRVKDAVVVAKDDGTGDRQLVAYVVPGSSA